MSWSGGVTLHASLAPPSRSGPLSPGVVSALHTPHRDERQGTGGTVPDRQQPLFRQNPRSRCDLPGHRRVHASDGRLLLGHAADRCGSGRIDLDARGNRCPGSADDDGCRPDHVHDEERPVDDQHRAGHYGPVDPAAVPGVTTTGASGTTTSSLPDDQRLLECERQARDAKVFYAPTQKMGKDETQQVQASASIGPATDTTSSPTTGAVSTTVVPVPLRCEVQAELGARSSGSTPTGSRAARSSTGRW